MKPKLFVSISTFLTSVVFAANCYAQEISLAKIPGVAMSTSNTSISSDKISVLPNVEKVFVHYFKDAKDLQWSKAGENYFASFTINGQHNTALFKKNGYMINHVSHGYEKHLPAEIRRMIKTHPDYFDHTITHVTNIKQNQRDVWAAYLELNNNVVLVRAEDGILEEVDRFKKTK